MCREKGRQSALTFELCRPSAQGFRRWALGGTLVPMRWFWRVAIAVIGSTILAFICTLGLSLVADSYFPGVYMKYLLIGALAFGALSSATFATVFLCRFSGSCRERETCCRRCGYILRGMSEPRCPECGERI